MNRFDRITAILIQLQSRKIVKAQDLAERFEISLRTVYRDISSLAEAGVPIIGEAGVGYSIMDGYRLPPVMFTKEEARTFITAEKLMEKFTDLSTQSQYQSAMFKIKSVLRSSEKSMVETLENHIEVRQTSTPFYAEDSNTLDILLKSITERKISKINYNSLGHEDLTERVIEPVGIYHENNYWYTIAYCHLRNNYRNFRSDRILKIELTDRDFQHKHAPLKDFLAQTWDSQNLRLIRIKLDKKHAQYIRNQKYYYGFVSEIVTDDAVEMSFLSASLESFAHWYLMLATAACILEPEILKDKVRKLLVQISEKI
ncbi:helix-turn-helix transcriptional regulator [Dyadobacter psychrophilus]|uniref:Predicted DNA-binding transcriptional regulator YafY, contains an HTH and WYL domains n=1 Tax=Dyadobacter psychrophilus TaxID=651661 RepID=A0A1T5EJ93_9BACT|nr:YafY family protein [Dyadobacter psychrophilus]SKB84014.1 Predicted DNA-binding transcriptional regulator YafY, contains an HTH and WYL domains [Dyadobacter psychrophilus]